MSHRTRKHEGRRALGREEGQRAGLLRCWNGGETVVECKPTRAQNARMKALALACESIGGRQPAARAMVQGVVPVTRKPGDRLHFRPIDVERDGALSVAFRRDSYVCSFGSDALFVEENGADGRGYLEWLRERVVHFPDGHVHAWRGPDIVGQIEMVIGPTSGYINLFYLRPDARGQGLGEQLHAYAVALLRRHGVRVAGLSVSPTNERALRYYERHGWRDLGARAGAAHVHEMALVVLPACAGTPG